MNLETPGLFAIFSEGSSGLDGISGVTGEDGEGIEYVFTASQENPLPIF